MPDNRCERHDCELIDPIGYPKEPPYCPECREERDRILQRALSSEQLNAVFRRRRDDS